MKQLSRNPHFMLSTIRFGQESISFLLSEPNIKETSDKLYNGINILFSFSLRAERWKEDERKKRFASHCNR